MYGMFLCVFVCTFVKQRKRVCSHAAVFSDCATPWKSAFSGVTGSKVNCMIESDP